MLTLSELALLMLLISALLGVCLRLRWSRFAAVAWGSLTLLAGMASYIVFNMARGL